MLSEFRVGAPDANDCEGLAVETFLYINPSAQRPCSDHGNKECYIY